MIGAFFAWGFVVSGFCRLGLLSSGVFVVWGFCRLGLLSSGVLSSGAFVPGAFVAGASVVGASVTAPYDMHNNLSDYLDFQACKKRSHSTLTITGSKVRYGIMRVRVQ